MCDFAVSGLPCRELPDHGAGLTKGKWPSQKSLSIFILGYKLHEGQNLACFVHYPHSASRGGLGTCTQSYFSI